MEIADGEFDKQKFKQVLQYIIYRCGHLENVGSTVLYKLLYFVDFDYYELYEEKLTGEAYRRLPHGPAPCHFEEAVKELTAEGKIVHVDAKFGGYDQQKFLSLKKPDVDALSGRELQVVEDVVAKYSGMTGAQIGACSHSDMPYKATEDGSIIEYELVFYRDPLFSVREYEDDERESE